MPRRSKRKRRGKAKFTAGPATPRIPKKTQRRSRSVNSNATNYFPYSHLGTIIEIITNRRSASRRRCTQYFQKLLFLAVAYLAIFFCIYCVCRLARIVCTGGVHGNHCHNHGFCAGAQRSVGAQISTAVCVRRLRLNDPVLLYVDPYI